MFDFNERYATVESLSPEARKLYELFTKNVRPESAKRWLAITHYVMDEDMNGVEAPFIEWAAQYTAENYRERQIRIDKLGDWLISTVFLGMDHGFNVSDDPSYKPVLWETMIFWQNDDVTCPRPDLDNDQDRYRSVQDAIRGHAVMVDKVKDALRGENAV
jgi:hypothetical protein